MENKPDRIIDLMDSHRDILYERKRVMTSNAMRNIFGNIYRDLNKLNQLERMIYQ